MGIVKALYLLLMLTYSTNSATLLPYGDNNTNDIEATGMSDDSSFEITTTTPLPFYGATYSSLWLGSNGYVALQDTVAFANSVPTPLNLKLIAPLFDDLRPSTTGKIHYRQTSDAADINSSSVLVADLFPSESPYTPTYLLVVTWSGYQKFLQTGTMTFQAVVSTDGTRTFAVFLYQQLITGLDADIGIDAGDGTNYYKLCVSGGSDIQSLPLLKQSCDSDPGVFGFRIDTTNPGQGSYNCTASYQDLDCAGCPILSDPANGNVDTSAGIQIGDNATYSCDGGFTLVGDSTRECLSNNSWSGEEPLCQLTPDCPVLTDPAHGTVDVSTDRQIGDAANYTCAEGYMLTGDATRTCLANSSWSGSEPTCQLTPDCPALTDPPNGQVDVPVDRQVGDVANYTCLGGFSLVGDSTRECLPNNTWSGSEPTCLILPDCNALSAPDHGYVNVSDSRQVGDIAVYSCIGGYDLEGNATRDCLSDSTWSGSQPYCKNVASYYCAWNDMGHTLVDVVFAVNLPGARVIMGVDTQKYEDGEDATVADTSCRTNYSTDPTTLTFTIDPYTSNPGCGVRSSGNGSIVLDITIRVYHDDIIFDVAGDRIYRFNCSDDTILPKSQTLSKEFNGVDVTEIPPSIRSLHLLVVYPDTDDIVTSVFLGELIQLRVIYNNTVSNVEPYGVFVTGCIAGDTMGFNVTTITLIQNGCVVEENGRTRFVTRAFRQASLSPSGLFITNSGYLSTFKFVNTHKVFFQCTVEFCYSGSTTSNLCTDSCVTSMRRKRSESGMNEQTLYTSVTILGLKEFATKSVSTKMQRKVGISNTVLYTILGSVIFLIVLFLTLSIFIFSDRIRSSKRRLRRRTQA